MKVLVAYATRHGATAGIAERIAATLQAEGLEAEARPAGSVKTLAPYDAFVIGSAAYIYHWLGDATKLVHRHRAELAAKPIGMAERAMKLMPAARDALPAGDFRDWPEIEAWARSIAADLRSGGG